MARKKAAPAKEAPAKAATPNLADWTKVGTVPLPDDTVFIGFVRGRQVEVLHRRGDFFADNGGAFSLRLEGVSHVRDRAADPA